MKTKTKNQSMNRLNNGNLLRMYFFILCSSLLIVPLQSCKKDTSWGADWVLPLVNDTITIAKFVNDSTIENNGGFYELNLKRNLYSISLTDVVTIPDTVIDRTTPMPFSSLNVPPGFEFYNKVEEHKLDLKDLELKKIELNGGAIDFSLSNPVETGVFLTIQLPGVTKDGITLSKTFFVPKGTVSNPTIVVSSIDLDGFSIDLTGNSGTSFNKLRSKVSIQSDPQGTAVVVKNTHVFQIKAKFRDVKLKYARGYFGTKELVDTSSFNLDILNNVASGAIDIQNTSIKLLIENGIKVAGSGKISYVKNTNQNSGSTVNLVSNHIGSEFTIDQPTGSFSTLQPTTRELLFTSSTSNIESLIENLGVKNELAYRLKLNPWGNTTGGWNEVFPQSRLKLSIEARMPLTFKMDQLTIRDTFALNLQQKKDKSHIQNGTLQIDLDNAFPFSGKIKVLFVDEHGQVKATVIGTQEISSSLYGELSSNGIMHKKSTVEIPLTDDQVDALNASKNMIIEAQFNTPTPPTSTNQAVQIPADAYLAIKAKAKFRLKMVVNK